MTHTALQSRAVSSGESFASMYPVLAALGRHRPRMLADYEGVLRDARQLRFEYLEPNALRVEREVMRDPSYVDHDAIRAASRHGFFSTMIPKAFGGGGLSFGAMIIALEELGAGCLGISNLLGVHGLAIATISATGDLEKMEQLCRRLTDGEKRGRPHLLSTAITEPGAGTDVEDVELLEKARLSCEATPVSGGYRLNGRKVFISNGSVADTHVVIMPTDKKRPVETTFAFLVDASSPGFRVGRVERKMGQKACPAAELVFDDCFVPESARVNGEPLPGRRMELVLGATRGGVGAWGTAAARGALERALRYAKSAKLAGRYLIDHQWVQLKLAEMQRNVMLARSSYVDAMLSNELFGLSALVGENALAELMRRIPQVVLDSRVVQALLTSRRSREQLQKSIADLEQRDLDVASAHGSAAKVSCTELGMQNCHLALEIFGAAGLRHDAGIEKLYRDAKLLTIYEGTNQLNRIEIFQRAVGKQPEPGPPRSEGRVGEGAGEVLR